MRTIIDYYLAIEKRQDYQEWCKRNGYISVEEFLNRGLTWAISMYDYDIIAEDAIEEFGNDIPNIVSGLKNWLNCQHGNASLQIARVIDSVKKIQSNQK